MISLNLLILVKYIYIYANSTTVTYNLSQAPKNTLIRDCMVFAIFRQQCTVYNMIISTDTVL